MPDPTRRREIEQRISNLAAATVFFQNSNQHLAAETAMRQARHWQRVLAEVEAWTKERLLSAASVARRGEKLDLAEAVFIPRRTLEQLTPPPDQE